VKGVKCIIRIASPIVLKAEVKPENFQKEFINPAVSATTNILKAAAKTTGMFNSPTNLLLFSYES